MLFNLVKVLQCVEHRAEHILCNIYLKPRVQKLKNVLPIQNLNTGLFCQAQTRNIQPAPMSQLIA